MDKPQIVRYVSNEDYLQRTEPIDFIVDLLDIMIDGDSLTPEDLQKDIVGLITAYLKIHGRR